MGAGFPARAGSRRAPPCGPGDAAAANVARIVVSSAESSAAGGKSSSRSSSTPGGDTRERSSVRTSRTGWVTGWAWVSCQTPSRSMPPATWTYAIASTGSSSSAADGSSPRLTWFVWRLATSISRRTPVRSTSSARNWPSVSSSSGQEISAAMFSRASGTGSASCAIRTFSQSTFSASQVRGTGSRWPASSCGEAVSTPPARTKAMCSVTRGAPSAVARSARSASRCSDGRSAPPRPSETPCGMTLTPRERRRVKAAGRWPGQMFSATTSTQSTPGSSSTASAISGRQPMPIPSSMSPLPRAV